MLRGVVGKETFGYDRWLNQKFYHSREWKNCRDEVLIRDDGFDMGDPETPIAGRILVHHMNPLTPEEIASGSDNMFNPEYLISVSHNTHNAIHYGDVSLLPTRFIERVPGDTKLW